jgi:ubiquinone/menaquinone biosynthesis C-methylase UbiE
MDAQELLFRDDLFDFVFSLNAFVHIPDPGRALQQISRVLKPGGTVFLQFNGLYFSDGGHHLSQPNRDTLDPSPIREG